MDIAISLQERLSQQLTLSPRMLQSIRILNLNIVDLHAYVADEIEKNPVIDFPASWEPRSCGCGLIDNLTRASAPTLRDDLRFQLHVSCLDERNMPIGEYVIDCIDDRGYLTESPADIAAHLRKPVERVKSVIDLIRTFEPIGVGAANIQECLAIQLQTLHQGNACVMAIVRDHLDDLARGRIDAIARQTGFSRKEIAEAAQIIQSLTLSPGEQYGEAIVTPIVPEILVTLENGSLNVRLVNELPTFTINESYAESAQGDTEAVSYLQQELSRAQWLLHCIGQRNGTLLKVATAIVEYQKNHFLNGTAPLPLTLEMIAETLAIHPSTVSRTVSDRYFEFNRQIHPFKSLFPSRLKTGESDARIKDEILTLIRQEDRRTPLSDQQISDLLNAKGMQVARRTIAKYRTEMNIEPACRRK